MFFNWTHISIWRFLLYLMRSWIILLNLYMTWRQAFSKCLWKLIISIIYHIFIRKLILIFLIYSVNLHTSETSWLMWEFSSKIFHVRPLLKFRKSVKLIWRFTSSWGIHSWAFKMFNITTFKCWSFFYLFFKWILKEWQIFRHW